MRKLLAILLFVCVMPANAGTWGAGVFDTDQSLDTASSWAEQGTVDDVRRALNVSSTNEYLEAPAAEDALVAAEVVAASWGRPNEELPEDLAAWIERQSMDDLRALTPNALTAIVRVRSKEGSELYELWADAGADEWLAHLDDLASRLRAQHGHEP